MVGRRHDNGIDVLPFPFEQLAEITVSSRLGKPLEATLVRDSRKVPDDCVTGAFVVYVLRSERKEYLK